MSQVASHWRQRGRFGVWGGGLATGLLVPINMCLLQNADDETGRRSEDASEKEC